MKMTQNPLWLAAALTALLAGCASKPATLPTDDTMGDSTSMGGDDTTTGSSMDSTIRSAGFADDDMAGDTADSLIIYFEYDRSEVSAQYADLLASHARRLANDSTQRLRLEGHADERGSREYNIGLGERRAQAVRRLLLIQGASSSQISTVSYGEERPAAFGSTESDYEKNRRVELSYR
ncbi:MAG: peptidoglycan-associated lipoprotein Pal [Pseudomonadota bacterium]